MSDEAICKDELMSRNWLPYRIEVLRSPLLSSGAKELYGEICSYFYRSGDRKAWPSQKALAQNLSCCVDTIKKRQDELVKHGVIGVRRVGFGRSNQYILYQPDMARLGVYEDPNGNIIPRVFSESEKTRIRGSSDSEKSRILESEDSRILESEESRIENLKSDASNSIVERDAAIGVGGEEEEELIIKKEEEAIPPLSLNSSKTDSSSFVCDVSQTKIENEKGKILTQPDKILLSEVPENARILGDSSFVCDSPREISSSTISRGKPQTKDTLPSPVVTENELDIKIASADGVDGDFDFEQTCPACDNPLFFNHGRVECIECDWSFRYPKFKERFLVEEDIARMQSSKDDLDDFISVGQTAKNSEFVCESQTKALRNLISSMCLETETKMPISMKDQGNGDKRSKFVCDVPHTKEETRRLLQRMDAAASIKPEG